MRILFYQGTPVPLRKALVGHTVEMAYERGRSALSHGELLTVAEAASFDVLLTTDRNLPQQQNLFGRSLAMLVLPTTRWPRIQEHVPEIAEALASIPAGECRDVEWR